VGGFCSAGTLVLVVGFAASFAFGQASAALRHLIWTAAVVGLLALPVVWQAVLTVVLTTGAARRNIIYLSAEG
jgi:hypothetical protein